MGHFTPKMGSPARPKTASSMSFYTNEEDGTLHGFAGAAQNGQSADFCENSWNYAFFMKFHKISWNFAK